MSINLTDELKEWLADKSYYQLEENYNWTITSTQDNNVDAFRHAFTSAWVTVNSSAIASEILGWAVEAAGSNSQASTSMDYFNNRIGIHLGQVIEASIGSDATEDQIASIVYSAMSSGDLAVALNDSRTTSGVTKTATSGKSSSLSGSSGEDSLVGSTQKDTLSGGKGYDSLSGGAGNDSLDGGDGGDYIWGGTEKDTIKGGKGYDIIDSGSGDDKIYGGSGKDILYSVEGNDTFVYESTSDSSVSEYDVIMDFSKGDKIDLSKIDANTKKSGDQAFTFYSTSNGVYETSSVTMSGQVYTRLAGDVNGDGQEDLMIYFKGNVSLSSSDFIL